MSRQSKLLAASSGVNLPSWASLNCTELLALPTGTKTECAIAAALVAEEAAQETATNLLASAPTYKREAPDPIVMETFLESLAAARANKAKDWCVAWTAASADGDEEEDHPAWCDEIEDPRAPEAWDPRG